MTKRILLAFLMLLFVARFAQATDYYTASASATLAGNSTPSTNWTTNPDGTTGLTSVTITAADNLIILNGGTATITAGMTISTLTINAGGKIVHNNNATASAFNINGLLTWNGTIKTLQAASGSNFFNANGDVIGSTALHDIGSTRSVYLGGDGLRTVNLTQVPGGIIASGAAGIQVTKNRKLVGNCIWYSPLIFGGGPTPATVLDLNGYDLQVSSIQAGNTTRLLKCNPNSSLSISGGQQATNLFLDPASSTLKKLTIDASMNPSGVTTNAAVNITGNLTTSTLYFGVPSGGTLVRTPQLTGNFTLADNGSMRIQSKGANDQLKVIGNITIGNACTLQFDLINAYAPSVGEKFDFATATGTITGIFASIQNPNNYTGIINYPAGKIQYEVLTGPPPAPACSMMLNPDLPLLPSNTTIDGEIESIFKRFSDNFLGTVEPSATALNTAIAGYNALGISVNGYNISSTTAVTSYDQLTFIKTFAQYLKFHPEDSTNIYTKALNSVWLVSDRMCKGLMSPDGNGYSFRNFGWSAILIPRFKDNFYVKSLFENLLNQQNVFDYLWEPDQIRPDIGYNIDHLGNFASVTLAYVKWIDSADERYRYMTAFKRMIGKYMRYSAGTLDGFKPDGTGFHHWAGYPSYTGYNLNPAADITFYLRQTSFQVSAETYLFLRDAIMAQLMFGTDKTTRSISMGGRKPQEFNTVLNRFSFRNMAVAGGSILGTGASDPVMATLHNRIWGGYAAFGNSTVAPFNAGYFQFNHSMAGIYRKDNWVATCKGFNNNMFGAEIYPSSNRFGRYQSYGAVDIVYAGDNLIDNGYDVTTRDWNFVPGTTVIRLPWDKLHAEKGQVDELQQKRFVGSLSFINKNSSYLKAIHGTYGMFAMDFQERTGLGWDAVYGPESHNNTFTFKKSVFTFDNMLICLGSGIGNNDAVNTTLTTLYQRKTATGKDVVNVDGGLLQAGNYNNNYSGTGNHWLVDNYNTGFYVFAGSGDIKLTRADQQTPNHEQLWSAQNIANNPVGNYAIGYIDHGTSPSNKEYEYICVPNASTTDMVNLNNQVTAGNKPYTVHRKDDIAHIVEYKPTATANSIFGYSFFGSLSGINNTGLLTGADYPCLVMSQYDSAQKKFQIAVNNPDLGFTWRQSSPSVDKQINITIKGTNWEIAQSNPRAIITGIANGETSIQFNVVDGLPVEIVLNRVLTPQTISFDTIPVKTTTDSAFVLTATASSGLAVSYTSSNTSVATINGSTVTIVGIGTTTITASQEGNDIYAAATPVQQTLTVRDNQPPVLTAPANVTVNTDAGAATASNVALGTATAIDNDAVQSITNNAPATYPVGVTQVTWTAVDNSGNTATAIQTVTVTDNEAPVVTAPASQSFCFAGPNYQVPALTATDNVGIATITYAITGATQRSGSGANASGQFEQGTSTITWTVTDVHGNQSTAVCTVTLNKRLNASIADVYALNPAVDLKNTLYLGYGPSTLTIVASPDGGTEGYTYNWSNGQQTQSIAVAAAGTYTVNVNDSKGCQTSASIQINVLDVRCGNNSNKVKICHNGNSICISSDAVQEHLSHGDTLGECGMGGRTNNNTGNSGEQIILVYPNPVQDILNISVKTLDANASVQVYNSLGMLVRTTKLASTNQSISFNGLAAGMYFVHVKNGSELIKKKIVKL
jgi:hypothetical protein